MGILSIRLFLVDGRSLFVDFGLLLLYLSFLEGFMVKQNGLTTYCSFSIFLFCLTICFDSFLYFSSRLIVSLAVVGSIMDFFLCLCFPNILSMIWLLFCSVNLWRLIGWCFFFFPPIFVLWDCYLMYSSKTLWVCVKFPLKAESKGALL